MLEKIQNGLIVSCQALEDEPLHSSFIMARMALAAMQGGAAGIRAQSVEDILAIKSIVHLPVIGIIKRKYEDSEVYITPTRKEVEELILTGCDMIAVDATGRQRPGKERVEDILELIHRKGILAMADCSTTEEGVRAAEMGFDCVATTLYGYTETTKGTKEPAFHMIKELAHRCKCPVIAEGRIHTPSEMKKAFECGAYSVVVGGAITRPVEITKRFVRSI